MSRSWNAKASVHNLKTMALVHFGRPKHSRLKIQVDWSAAEQESVTRAIDAFTKQHLQPSSGKPDPCWHVVFRHGTVVRMTTSEMKAIAAEAEDQWALKQLEDRVGAKDSACAIFAATQLLTVAVAKSSECLFSKTSCVALKCQKACSLKFDYLPTREAFDVLIPGSVESADVSFAHDRAIADFFGPDPVLVVDPRLQRHELQDPPSV